jgi:dTDP-4-dehydrorhamnose reductase
MRVLVLGVTGMLGSVAFRLLQAEPGLSVFGTARSPDAHSFFDEEARPRISTGVDAENFDSLVAVFDRLRPDIVINCIGVVRQLAAAKDPLVVLPLNSLLPHRLARLSGRVGARLIHISTDCVFSGSKGDYRESDFADADDLYGRSKLLGEVNYPNAITLRTSIIGRELTTRNGLVEWFLSAGLFVRGYTKAIFTGLTTDELTRVIARFVLRYPELHGIYQVSSDPISKYDLLNLIKSVYCLDTHIEPDDSIRIDRSLDSSRFRTATGYSPPSWAEMIRKMRALEAGEVRRAANVQ